MCVNLNGYATIFIKLTLFDVLLIMLIIKRFLTLTPL